jgi:LuxR family maltose regulon positive regulatory protein
LGKVSSTLLIRGEFGILTGWFQRLPEEILRSQPELCQVYAWALLLTGKLEAAENLLECADALADQNPIILGKNAAAKAYLAQVRGDGRKLIQESERALALLPASFETDRGLVALSLGMAYWHIGKLKEAESVLEEARRIALKTSNDYAAATAEIFQARCQAVQGKLQLAEKSYLGILESGPQVSILVIAHLDLGAIYLEWNDLDRAAGHLQQALAIAKLSGNAEFQIAGLILQSLLKFIQGDRSGAFTTLREAKQMDASSHAPLRATQRLNALQVELVLASGEVEEASRLGGDLTEEVDWHPFYRFLGLTRARLMLAQGYTLEAAEYLYSCVKKASEAGWGYGVIAARLLQAMCADTPGTALTFLTEAINLARPERFIRSFIETGEPLIPLLRKAASQGVAPIYIREILKEMEDKPERRSPEDAGLVEPLSEREIEVLRQVTAGLSNREIAEKLVIGLGTVKTHIHHICGKLGVRNRTEAAMKAKELKLV